MVVTNVSFSQAKIKDAEQERVVQQTDKNCLVN